MFICVVLLVLAGCSTLNKPPVELPKDWVPSCGAVENTKATFCFYRVGTSPTRTLWYFPGLLESSSVITKSFFDESGFRQLIQDMAPIDVVVIGYGKGYYIRPPGTVGTPSFDEVINKVMPYIEKTYSPAKPYISLGMSEGGANLATIISIKPDFFERAFLAHPMVLQEAIDPFNILQIPPCKACLLVETNFTKDEWQIANPFYLMRAAKKLTRAAILACPTDEFKLFPGAQELANLAKLRGFDMTFITDVAGCKHVGWQNGPIELFFK